MFATCLVEQALFLSLVSGVAVWLQAENIGSGLFYISEVKQNKTVVDIEPVCTVFTMLFLIHKYFNQFCKTPQILSSLLLLAETEIIKIKQVVNQ